MLGAQMIRLAFLGIVGFSASVHSIEVDCFRANNAGAAFVSVELVDLLATADERNSKISSFSLGDRTCALTETTINGRDWVFVQGYWLTKDRTQLQGWLPKESIAYRNQLSLHKNVRAQSVDVGIGDYSAQDNVKTGGGFEVVKVVSEHKCKKGEIPNEYGACEDLALVRGHFYGRGRLAIAISSKYGESDVFKLLDDGTLCPWQYGHPPDSCR